MGLCKLQALKNFNKKRHYAKQGNSDVLISELASFLGVAAIWPWDFSVHG